MNGYLYIILIIFISNIIPSYVKYALVVRGGKVSNSAKPPLNKKSQFSCGNQI